METPTHNGSQPGSCSNDHDEQTRCTSNNTSHDDGPVTKRIKTNDPDGSKLNNPDGKNDVRITHEPLDVQQILDVVTDPVAGAISTFLGTTRNHHDGKAVIRLEYEGYEKMAEKKLLEICNQIRQKWDVTHIAMWHRLGVVGVTESSVAIAVSSPHRKESIEAAAYGIDTLKAEVPIWKLEVYQGDDAVWKENREWTRGKCCGKMERQEIPKGSCEKDNIDTADISSITTTAS
eukprot:CAMPEP_0194666674 /NCGR_PEP_ID=MMETSP0295-20121207/2868_1 /TAXON_ID=39354 /ORGANISM="Heterosigma akashiwo, Strain CCMP2393" /LENGTH=232 /DNA_ID=CAMNT_0039548993 /DNA_START=9 /DNA_END=706 /DNA_ORIENTATION=-